MTSSCNVYIVKARKERELLYWVFSAELSEEGLVDGHALRQ
jgi:hypothetical protein